MEVRGQDAQTGSLPFYHVVLGNSILVFRLGSKYAYHKVISQVILLKPTFHFYKYIN